MSQLPSVGLSNPTPDATVGTNDLRDVELDQFLQLMIAELQNQDPLDPMENGEILQQVTQIREIGATNKLSETLDSLLIGQNLTTGSSLIGKQVSALSDDGNRIEGTVDRVSVATSAATGQRSLRVHIGEDQVRLENVSEVVSADGELTDVTQPTEDT